jgi:glycosyltransferase involved in cell wall biosynthesis
VAISDYARSQVLRWTHASDWQRIHVIRCGVGGTFLERSRVAAGSDGRLVSIGRLDEQKGHRVLLGAAEQLAREGLEFELAVIGDGPLRGELEQLVHERGLARHVRMTGWAPAAEVARELDRSRALVLSSFAEGLPVVIMESLALGRPVVATDVGAVSELVRTGETGWLAPPGSSEALADAMRHALAAEPAELDRMGAAGAALVGERHSAAAEAARLAELFAASVERRRARG